VTTFVLLLRGINVGGANRLKMADLSAAIEAAGGTRPETYIQSGNAVFTGRVSSDQLAEEIDRRAGIRPDFLTLSADDFLARLDANPFPTDDHKALHLYFLPQPTPATMALLDAAKSPDERAFLTPEVLYLHTPKHLSGSRLAPALDRLLGVRATGRNWRTCTAIRDMIKRRT
jgi:uncharacterized protein (DUF1697 family)